MARKKKKIQILEGEAVDIGHKGMAVCKTEDGEVFMVQGAVPGDRIEAQLFRKKKGVWTGQTQNILAPSPHRIEAPCIHFTLCGGCQWQDLDYKEQLRLKENSVRNVMQRIGGIEIQKFHPIIGCDPVYYYRNKLEFTFSDQRWLTEDEMKKGNPADKEGLGFNRPGRFDKILDIRECLLQPEPSNAIRNFIRATALAQGLSFYNVRHQKGFLRNLIIRTTDTGDLMVILVVKTDEKEKIELLLSAVQKKFPEITSLFYIINPKANDSIFDLEPRLFSGQPFITEKLGDRIYQIGPKSFFQTNTRQAKVLYDKIRELGDFDAGETVYDLYCGLGSIGIYLADRIKKVIGVEEIEEAVKGAHINKNLNQMPHCHFYAGDVRQVLSPEFVEEQGHPDTVIVDPPRAGLHPDVTQFIKTLEPKKIIYVSCNPATQARDMSAWTDLYECREMQPVDMFPHTGHIENIALMIRKDKNERSDG